MDTTTNQKLVTSILRFNFTDEVMDIITQFAKIHKFDDRHTYRENWDKWFEENNSILLKEIQRLTENGYDGDVKDKMYKAGRYYFRKKNNNAQTDSTKKESTIRKESTIKKESSIMKRNYISMDKIVIEEMDKHIRAGVMRKEDYTPANGYSEFCKLHDKLLVIEKKRINLECNIENEKILDKFKKTYKNRYFILTR
jgi:hypothetical protein